MLCWLGNPEIHLNWIESQGMILKAALLFIGGTQTQILLLFDCIETVCAQLWSDTVTTGTLLDLCVMKGIILLHFKTLQFILSLAK